MIHFFYILNRYCLISDLLRRVMKIIIFILISLILSLGITPIVAFIENDVPEWIKTNERWVTEGKITEQEYMVGLQYLADIESLKNSQLENKITKNNNENKEKRLQDYINKIAKKSKAPTEQEIAKYYVVSIYGGPLKKISSSHTFHEVDFNYMRNLPNGFDLVTKYMSPEKKIEFIKDYRKELDNPTPSSFIALKSVPGKDKQRLYDVIAILDKSLARTIKPLDMKVETFSGDSTLIHTVFLKKCRFIDYNIFVQNSFSFDTEFLFPIAKDETILECNGSTFKTNHQNTMESEIKLKAPFEVKRKQSNLVTNFDVHFQASGITKSSESFTRFVSSYEGSKTTFVLESMTSNDKSWYYKTLGIYSKNEHLPGKIMISVDIKSDDGTVLQTWNYSKCKPGEIEVILEEDRDIVDRVIFECAGTDMTSGQSFVKRRIGYSNDPLTEDEIAKTFRLHFDNGNLEKRITYDNLLKFSSFEYVKVDPKNKSGNTSFGFWMEILSSKKMIPLYKDLEYYFSATANQAPFNTHIELITKKGESMFSPSFKSCKIILVDPQMKKVNGERKLVDRIAFECNSFVTEYKK